MSDGEDVESPSEEGVADASVSRLLDKLSEQYDFDFREYRRTSLARRIKTRMQQVRVDTLDRYSEYLDLHPDEHAALFNTILINVTAFFRDPDVWKILGDEVIPRLIDQAGDSGSLRLWSVGCSSGEEAYSMAILLAEQLGPQARDLNVKIYATDVDEDALGAGRHGLYLVDDLKEVPTTILERYFSREGQTYRFRRDLRRWVIFGRHNIVQDSPLSHIDLVICRNVLIYFTSDLQEKILARFHYAIREGGYLCLGRAESLLARSRWFSPVNLKWRIFQRTTAPAPTVASALFREGQEAGPVTTGPRTEPTEHMNRLMRVIEALPSAVMMIDAMDNILVWNAAAEALYDNPGDATLNRKFRDLDISYRIEGLRARVEEVKTRHIPARLENATFTRPTGDVVHADIIIVPILEGHRIAAVVVAAVVVSAVDATDHAALKEQTSRISEQHATAIEELQSTNEELETTVEELQAANVELASLNVELERRSSEMKQLDDYQRRILSSLDDAVLVLDRDGVVTTWNQTAERMWGLVAENAVGRPFWTLPIGDMPRLARGAITRVLERGEAQAVRDVSYVVPTGESRKTTLRLSPLRNGDGEIVGVVGLAHEGGH